jgi:type II secretory pathway component PulC
MDYGYFMDGLTKHYSTIINFALIMLLNIAGGILFADIIAYYLYTEPEYKPFKQIRGSGRKKRADNKNKMIGSVKDILGRNLFCSTCPPFDLSQIKKNINGDSTELQLVTLQGAELLSTMVSDSTKYSLSTIRVTAPKNKVYLLSVGDKVGEATVIKIEHKVVTFLKGDQEQILKIGGKGETKKIAKKTKKKTSKNKNDLSSKITKISEFKYEVEKEVVKNFMKYVATAGRGAKVMPAPGGGYKAKYVRSYSILYKLGIRSGDVIKSVNNTNLDSFDQTLSLIKMLKTANHLTLSVNRRGKTVNMDYTIR